MGIHGWGGMTAWQPLTAFKKPLKAETGPLALRAALPGDRFERGQCSASAVSAFQQSSPLGRSGLLKGVSVRSIARWRAMAQARPNPGPEKRPEKIDVFRTPVTAWEIWRVLKGVNAARPPEAPFVRAGGLTEARKQLLLIGSQMLGEMHALRQDGASQAELVVYYQLPPRRVVDPDTHEAEIYHFAPDMTARVARPVRDIKRPQEKAFWEHRVARASRRALVFSELETARLSQPAVRHGFDLSAPVQRLEYFEQLMRMLSNALHGWQSAQQEVGDGLLGHYHLGIRYLDKHKKPQLRQLTPLFPQCDLNGYLLNPNRPAHHS